MEFKEVLVRELVKKGYSELEDGTKVWDISNRYFLYMTPELSSYFLKARNHPRYKKTILEIEANLLKNNAKYFTKGLLNEPFNFIDIAAVDGTKAKVFLEALESKGNFRFCPVSPSNVLAELSIKTVKEAGLKNVKGYKANITYFNYLNEAMSLVRTEEYNRNLILLLESTLAAFEIHEFLFKISQAMLKGDALIIGNSIRIGERFANLETYKSPLFREWFIPLIHELGFLDSEVEYDSRFANGRVEGFFKVKNSKKVSFGEQEVSFRKGDEIIVSILYKYYEKELLEYCKMYFREVKLVKDKENEYALILCKK